jgi:hypothetical protein
MYFPRWRPNYKIKKHSSSYCSSRPVPNVSLLLLHSHWSLLFTGTEQMLKHQFAEFALNIQTFSAYSLKMVIYVKEEDVLS